MVKNPPAMQETQVRSLGQEDLLEKEVAAHSSFLGFPGSSDGKASVCNEGDLGLIPGFDPWVGNIPWRRKWQPTPVSLPGESRGRRSLVGYGPQGHKESDTTKRLQFSYTIGNSSQYSVVINGKRMCKRVECLLWWSSG